MCKQNLDSIVVLIWHIELLVWRDCELSRTIEIFPDPSLPTRFIILRFDSLNKKMSLVRNEYTL